MKTSVRFISLLLAIFMLAGMAITVSANDTLVAAAPDTTGDEAMAFLKALGIMVGDENKNMNSDGFLKRSEVAKLIYVLKTTFSEAEETDTEFIDVDDGHWASGYINALNVMGVIGGYGDGTFRPDDYVTGDQLAKMLLGVLGVSDFDSKLWPTDVRAAASKCALYEKLDTKNLSQNIKRRHAAQMIYNIFDDVIKDAVTGREYTLLDFFGAEVVDAIVSGITYLTIDTVTDHDIENPVAIRLLEDSVQLGEAQGTTLRFKDGVICSSGVSGAEEYLARIVELYVKDGEIIGHAIKRNKVVEGFKLNNEETALDYEDDGLVITEATKWLNPQLNNGGAGGGYYVLAEKLRLSSKPASDADIVEIAKHPHVALIIDNNDDGIVDYILWDKIAKYEINTVNTVGLTFTANPHASLNGNNNKGINRNQVINFADIGKNTEELIAHATFGKLEYLSAEIKEGVITSWSNNKITVGEKSYELNKDIFATGDATDAGFTSADCVGEKYKVFTYSGVVYKAERVYSEDELIKFALLLYVEEPQTPEYDSESHTFTQAFYAMVNIGGRDRRIPISQETYDYFVTDNDTPFTKTIDENGYLVTYPTLVTYTVDEDGVYSLNDNLKEDGAPVSTRISTGKPDEYYYLYDGATLKRDDLLWTAYNKDGQEITNGLAPNKVDTIIDSSSQIFYRYTKEETGGEEGHKHYGTLTVAEAKKLSKSSSNKNAFTGILYGRFNEAGDFFYVVAAYIEDVKYHETVSTSTKSYKNDGRQIFYCYKLPVQTLSADGESVVYAHAFKNITSNSNKAEVVVKVANSQADIDAGNYNSASVACGFYGYDENTDTYYKLDKNTIDEFDATSIGVYTFQKVFNNCIFATGGNGDLVNGVSLENAKLYKVKSSDSKSLSAITANDIKEKANEGTLGELIILTYKDSKGNTQISAVIANYDNKAALNEFKTPSSAN